jgi:hypothetical protein
MLAPIVLSAIVAATTNINADSARTGGMSYCKAVAGEITAAATRISPTLSGLKIRAVGRSAGGLDGDVDIEVVKPFVGNSLRTTFSVVSAEARTTVTGVTVLARTDSIDGVRPMRFESAARDWIGAGAVNHRSRQMRFVFTGRLCAR